MLPNDPNTVQGRPPYIQFREDLVEDRAKTLETGIYSTRATDIVVIRQAGSKDSVEKEAKEWLSTLSQNRNMSPDWVQAYKRAYATWKEDRTADTVVQGTHIRMWPAISRGQADVLLNAQCRSVEDLANANEEILTRIGIGARELQQRAKAWLETAKDTGRVSEEVVALRTRTGEQDTLIKSLQARLQALEVVAGAAAQQARTITPSDDFS